MKKKTLLIVGIIALLGAAYGFYMFNKPVGSLVKATPDHKLSATELLAAYEQNEEAANDRYLDKVIQVRGTIDKVETSGEKSSIYLATDNMMSSVICELDDRREMPEGLKAGDEITLKGLCTGYLMDVVIIRTVII